MGTQEPPAVCWFPTVKVQKPMTFGLNLPMIPALSTEKSVHFTSTQRIESMNDLHRSARISKRPTTSGRAREPPANGKSVAASS